MAGEVTTKKCQFCYSDIDARATVCPHCRGKVAEPVVRDVKKSNQNFWIILALLVTASCAWLVFFSGNDPSPSSEFDLPDSSGPEPTSRPTNLMVIYTVTGSASSVDLTIENESGNTEQHSEVDLPYQKSFRTEPGQFVYVSAQNNDESGSVECKITVDGRTLETASSSGAYVIASCGGLVD